MNFIERKKRLDYLLEMLQKGRCISSHQMAQKFNCSSRTIERMLSLLRNEGYSIKYCKEMNKYKLDARK